MVTVDVARQRTRRLYMPYEVQCILISAEKEKIRLVRKRVLNDFLLIIDWNRSSLLCQYIVLYGVPINLLDIVSPNE